MSRTKPSLPDSWKLTALPDVAEITMGQSPSSADVNELGLGVCFFQGKAEFGKLYPTPRKYCTKPTKLVSAGDILLSVRAPVGPTNIATETTAIGRGLAGINAYKCYSDSKFLLHYFRFIEPWLSTQGTGSTFKAISGQFIKDLKIQTPPPFEQQIITKKLDTLLAQVDNTKTRLEQIPKILKRFREAVLAAAVNGSLTDQWRGDTPFGKTISLGEVIIDGPQNGLYKPSSFYGAGTKIIRIDSFYEGKVIDWSKIKKVTIDDNEEKRWKLNIDDVLINRVNSIEYLGKCAHIKHLPESCVFESNIMRFSVNKEKITPQYLTIFLCSPNGIFELRKNAKLAINQASINQTDVKNCRLIAPEVKEQKEIVRQVEQLFALADTVEKQVNAALDRVNHLTQSILAKAFRGELTAQWRAENPDLISGENSAAALLERIKAERAASGTKKTSRKKP